MDHKRVLVIATAELYLAGITTVLVDIANCSIDFCQLSFALAESGDPTIIDQLKKMGTVYELPSRKHHLLLYLCALRKVMKQGNYDIVHIHGNSATMAFDLSVAFLCKIPKRITHCHSCAPQPRLKQMTLKKVLNILVTNPVACSSASGNMLYNKNFIEIHNCVECNQFRYSEEKRQKMRRQLSISEDSFVVGHIGRFSKEKNQLRLISIFANILKECPNSFLILCGEGETLKECKDIVHTRYLQNQVLFTGEVNNPEDYYSAMDVFVLPSFFEGFPLVGVEAQANGLPCVFSDTITREIQITSNCHFMSLNSDDFEWAKTITHLHAENRSHAAEIVSKAGYDRETMKGQVLLLYD